MGDQPTMIALAGGVNLLDDPKMIRDDQVVRAQNLYPTIPGVLSSRSITQFFDSSGVAGTPIQLFVPPFESPVAQVLTCRNVLAGTNTETWAAGNGGSPVASHGFGTVTKYKPAIVVFNRKIYVFPGVGANVQAEIIQADLTVPNGFTFSDFTFAGAGNALVFPQVAANYRKRLFYANLATGYESYFTMCDPGSPDTIGANALAANGRNQYVGDAGDGDRIVAAREVMLTAVGGIPQSALLILREYSAFMMTGEWSASSSSTPTFGDVDVKRFNFECGCSSADTLVSTPYGVFWASWDDVWFFPTGQGPVRIGTNIRPALARTPPDKRYLWHMEYDPIESKLMLAVAGEGQSLSDDSRMQDQWWLDLRGPLPTGKDDARWWGPQQFRIPGAVGGVTTATLGTRNFAREVRTGKPKLLYTADADQNGGTVGMYSFGTVGVRDFQGVTPSIETVLDSEVPVRLVTKDYSEGDSAIQKVYQGMEVYLWNSLTNQLVLNTIMDGGLTNDSQNKAVLQNGFVLGVDPLGTALSRAMQAFAIYPDPTLRDRANSFQFDLQGSIGYYVGTDNNTFCFTYFGTEIVATLAVGLYADVAAFAAQLVTKMTAAAAAIGIITTFTTNQSTSPRPALATISVPAGPKHWAPQFQTSASATAAQLRRSRKIGTLLGFDTTSNPAEATTQTAANNVWLKNTCIWQIGSLGIRMFPIPRRPV